MTNAQQMTDDRCVCRHRGNPVDITINSVSSLVDDLFLFDDLECQ